MDIPQSTLRCRVSKHDFQGTSTRRRRARPAATSPAPLIRIIVIPQHNLIHSTDENCIPVINAAAACHTLKRIHCQYIFQVNAAAMYDDEGVVSHSLHKETHLVTSDCHTHANGKEQCAS